MKHVYLIIAHGDFEVLQLLIDALDDSRNDIFLHIDKKIINLPKLSVRFSRLFFVEKRVDVRWGSYSQIETEFLLFQKAYENNLEYAYFHLISGTHLPLKNQDELHRFFESRRGKEVINLMYTNSYEINFKLGRYHYFLNHYRFGTSFQQSIAQLSWQILIKLQYWFKIVKQEPNVTMKANNWVSITNKAVELLLENRSQIEQLFRRTFCGDEYLIPFLLEKNKSVLDFENSPQILYNEFIDSNPRELTMADYDFLMQSDYLFARKFSDKNIDVAQRIVQDIKSRI